MPKTIFAETQNTFRFIPTIYGHGWSQLLPFQTDDEKRKLKYVFQNEFLDAPVKAEISAEDNRLKIELAENIENKKAVQKILKDVRHILRFDDDLSDFYKMSKKDGRLAWISREYAGRLLRSPTVFEDLVKTICTTNCSWSLTKKMVANLVENLGWEAADGSRAFPSAEAMADVPRDFYSDVMRAGYRAPYFAELADRVASGELKPEEWLDSELPTAELKKRMKKIKGVGDYAAENLLKLVGRYDGLALDSWLRAQFYKKHNGERICEDFVIETHYEKFGDWRGLVIWFDMTERLHN